MSEKRSSVSSTSSTKGTNGDGGAMVVLNVYDMCTVNSYLPSWMGVGIYHSGIQIYSNGTVVNAVPFLPVSLITIVFCRIWLRRTPLRI